MRNLGAMLSLAKACPRLRWRKRATHAGGCNMPRRRPKRTFLLVALLLTAGLSIALWRLGLGLLYAYLIGINAATIVLYGYDKRQAIGNGGRVPELVLHVAALAGGSPGALLAQGVFRHKTKKLRFKVVFVGIVLLQLVLAYGYWHFVLRGSQ